MFDGEAFGAQIVDVVRGYVEDVTAPLLARISELEKRPTLEAMNAAIAHAVREAVAEIPAPKDGADGRDGTDGAPGEKGDPGRDGAAVEYSDVVRAVSEHLAPREGVLNLVAVEVERFIAQHPLPAGEKGEPGRDGADGAPGRDGVDGMDAEPISPVEIELAIKRHLEANPPAAGRDGKDGRDGDPGQPGERGLDGKDGVGLGGALIDRDGRLVVTLTDGTTRELGPVVGKDGAPGRDGSDGKAGADGKDGLEPDKIELAWGDDGRTLTARFVYGETAMVIEAEGEPAPFCIDRGVYKAGETYVKGDGVTCGGSYSIAQRETTARPDAGSDDWRLAVRRGRDGKDGKPGDPGAKGEKGDPGRDGKSWA